MTMQITGKNNAPADGAANRVTALLLIVYLTALVWILLFKLGVRFSYMDNRRVNLFPFRELILYGKADVSQIILNIVVFVPLGIYAGIFSIGAPF